jgi:hypothetical protein
MTFTLAAFFESVQNASLANVAALGDTKYTTNGDDFRVPPEFTNLIAAYAVGATITRARLSAPSLLKTAPLELPIVDSNAEPASRPPLIKMVENPHKLTAAEALNALTTNSATGADDQTVAVWLAKGSIVPVNGKQILKVRATGTITAVADTWTNGSITLDSDLDPGTYALVGARMFGATAILCRFIFTKDEARPGMICHDAVTDIDDEIFHDGRLGEWGQFQHDTPPKIEIYCAAADSAQTLVLDLVRIS